MSFFEDIYWDTFCNHFWEIGLKYIAVPFAVNPMVHVPTDGNHDLDWGMASSNGDMGVRASITYRYMRRIIRRYQGEIVGNHWGAPIGPIPYSQIPSFHARIRISPNLAAESNIRYPIDCGSKVHELASLGSFQIASENSALRKYYAPDEVVACRNPHEFNDLFDYYIDRPDDRSACVVKAMRRSITENTYFNRINALIGVLDARPEFFLY
jgi:spore maturation protein CgeB